MFLLNLWIIPQTGVARRVDAQHLILPRVIVTGGRSAGFALAEGRSAGFALAEGFFAGICIAEAEKPSAMRIPANGPSAKQIPANGPVEPVAESAHEFAIMAFHETTGGHRHLG